MNQITILFCVLLYLSSTFGENSSSSCHEYLVKPEVRRFKNYVTINTTLGQDLQQVVDFWDRLTLKEDVEMKVYEQVENYPVIVIKWPGRNSSLTSIMLLGHMDVVPAYYEDGWTYPPFSGMVNEQCEMVGRGTQDMKSGVMQYFEAMSSLKNNNVTLLRDVYIVITPDETSGSLYGIELFVQREEFKAMNVGFALDVGAPSPGPGIVVFYEDKTRLAVQVDCYGQTTNTGILLNRNETADGVCANFYYYYYQYREKQYRKSLKIKDFSNYTSINFLGGCNPVTYTAYPGKLSAHFSAILSPKTTVEKFTETLYEWVDKAGGNIKLTIVYEQKKSNKIKIDDSNPYWVALEDVFEKLNIPLEPVSSPSTSDSNYVVKAGIPTFGLSPQRNTEVLVYAIDERLSLKTYLEGIHIYKKIIKRIANLPESEVGDDPSAYIDYSTN